MKDAWRIQVWGVRGSGPAASADYLEYGGNTSCISVTEGGQMMILDAGSGLYRLGEALKQDGKIRRLHIFLSHPHMDHIQGLFDFAPFYDPEFTVHLYGEAKGQWDFQTLLKRLLGPPYWPVGFGDFQAKVVFHEIGPGHCLTLPGEDTDVLIRTFRACHPGGSLMYRLEGHGKCLAYLLDCEADEALEEEMLGCAGNADLIVWDAGYTKEDLQKGWGHSTWEQGVDFLRAAKAGEIWMTHYNRRYTDSFLRRQEELARASSGSCRFAREGMEMTL